MMEDHVVDFLKLWKIGLGVLAEQGAESIHPIFNQLERTYSSMTNKVDKL